VFCYFRDALEFHNILLHPSFLPGTVTLSVVTAADVVIRHE